MVDNVQQLSQTNSLVNQTDTPGLSSRIASAIKTAADKTGVDFSYLLHKAAQESGFDPNAKASTSSATGLFQFTNQTWLQTLKQHGGQYGLSAYADHIQVDSTGVARVSDPGMKQVILGLRRDPQISAEMAGELDKQNMDSLKTNVGGKIGATDLYLAHFLGAGGASDFLNEMKANPNANAAAVLPDAAAANPSIFYANGQPRTLAQIYNHFAQKFDSSTSTMVASASSHRAPGHMQAVASSSYAVAGAATNNVSGDVNSSYAASVMSHIKTEGSSSLMATMILAQMHMSDMPAASGYGSSATSNNGHRNAISILGSIA